MNWNGKKLISFDIETTGLDVDSKIVCINTYDGENSNVYFSLENFIKQNFKDKILVGYNSGNWRGGFDLNYIRTYCVKNNIDYHLNGVIHLDIIPLVRKYFNTTIQFNKIPSVSSLRKDDLVFLANKNDLEYTTKKDTYKRIKQLGSPDWQDYEKKKHKKDNSLQKVYQILFDPNCEEEYIDGADTDELLQQGKIGEVVRHCTNDIIRTYKITNQVLDLVPNYPINKNLTEL